MADDNKKNILIVEDDAALREALSLKLNSEHFTTLEAKDGEEGLRVSLEQHPDLILLDIVMPKVDGLTVMKKLREDDWGKTVPIILLTNLSVDDKILAAVTEHEPSYYLVKTDWRIDDVVGKIKERLGLLR